MRHGAPHRASRVNTFANLGFLVVTKPTVDVLSKADVEVTVGTSN
jgi:hypothetical protein